MRDELPIMLKLYDYADSGNGYKVRLALHQLGTPYQLVPVDIMRGESRTESFLAKNPNGRIPLLELEDGFCLPESNAILCFVARDSRLLPSEPRAFAEVLSWLFFEQYSHEPYVATSRFILRHLPAAHPRREELTWRLPRAHEALAAMERHLLTRTFFVGERYSVADIGLYAYTHRAHEASLDLSAYPALRRWLARVEAEPGYVPMLPDEPAHPPNGAIQQL